MDKPREMVDRGGGLPMVPPHAVPGWSVCKTKSRTHPTRRRFLACREGAGEGLRTVRVGHRVESGGSVGPELYEMASRFPNLEVGCRGRGSFLNILILEVVMLPCRGA